MISLLIIIPQIECIIDVRALTVNYYDIIDVYDVINV